MCLGVPGKIVHWINQDSTFALAKVEFSGVCRKIHMACVPDARVGQYVIVHAGVAICVLEESEAKKTLATIAELEEEADEVPR